MSGQSRPIVRYLIWVSVFSSGSALLAASLVLLFFQLQEVRSSLRMRLETAADLIAFNIAPAVDFNDAETAKTLLGALRTRREVLAAGVLVHGREFAKYTRDSAATQQENLLHPIESGHQFTDGSLTVYRPISAGGRPLGTLFIRIDLIEYEQTWGRFMAITGLVAIPAFLLAIVFAQFPLRAISRPILNLATVAAAVSDKKDYSVRAPQMRSAAEIEQLIDTFNQMLVEIQTQHAALEESRATLEQRVEERTSELTAANRELESFSYSVSHDLRAPLRAIDGFSKAVMADYGTKLDDRGVHFLQRVRAGTQTMSQLIDDMLHLSQVTRRPLERAEIDISAIACDVAAELARRNPERQVSISIEPGMRASADPHLIRIAFENLIGNAWKFTAKRADACIEVGRTTMHEQQGFFVRDNGAGFNAAYSAKLFGAFQRLHDSTQFEGTGIGLATVKRIITRHGGEVAAEGAEGAGATFYFTLGGKS